MTWTIASRWLLSLGLWDDEGAWLDSDTWNDDEVWTLVSTGDPDD